MEKNLFRELYKRTCGLTLKDCPPSSLSGLLHGYLSVYSMVRVYPWLEDEFEGPWDIHERVREIARMIQELLKDGDIPVDTRAGYVVDLMDAYLLYSDMNFLDVALDTAYEILTPKGSEKMVTINDIAKYCNVSGATVSYVLSGKGAEHRISLSTQNQILNAAEELGYTRKQINSSNNLKIAVYFMYKELEMTIPPLIYGISNVISSEVLPIDLIIRPYDLGQLSDYKYLWKNGGCNAAIIVAAGIKDLQFLESNKPSVPVVLLNRDLPGYSSVSIDHEEAGRLTAEHAISVGGSDIAVVLNPSTLYGFNLRSSTIFKICEERGINIKDNLFYGNNQIDTGYEIGWEMVRKNKLHKVIICMYDMVAMGIISALNEAGISVGK